MPSVRIEDDAFGDLRFDILATEAGLADADHARGKMIRLWRQCTAENVHTLPEAVVVSVLGSRGVSALIVARLGEKNSHGVRIKGTKGRIEWLANLRKNGAKGGRPIGSKTKTRLEPSGFREPNPLALVTAPALVTAQDQICEPPAPRPANGDPSRFALEPEKPAKQRRGQRVPMPADFRPDASVVSEARTGCVDLDREIAKLRDWSTSKGEYRVDWQATARNWIRSAADRQGPGARASPARAAPASSIDATAQALRERGFDQ